MSIFSFLSKADSFPKPWDNKRLGIYAFIKSHISPTQTTLNEDASTLPDEKIFFKDGQGWVAGGLDGAFGHHVNPSKENKLAKKIHVAFQKVIQNTTKENVSTLYKLLSENTTLEFIDELLPLIANTKDINFDIVQKFARWLAENSPDRELVKAAIAILGIFPGDQNKNLFIELGLHEEFTLYSAIALGNTLKNPELELWNLAKCVHGWGRIQVVKRLTNTQNEEIKRWMLRHGYRNSVMNEYLAYTCAVTGNLLSALKKDRPDDELLVGASDIIEALICGGPARDIDYYDDGAEVVMLYLKHVSDKISNFDQLLTVITILRFIENKEANWNERKKKGWDVKLRKNISETASAILSNPEWKEKAISVLEAEISSDEHNPFHKAALVAESLGVDTWDYYYKRQKYGYSDEWYFLMQTKDKNRIDKVIALAEKTIPLDKIATGPDKKLGTGSEFKYHNALDFILQDLCNFPGKGWKLVKAGLCSPVVRNRNVSLKVLSTWGKKNWSKEVEKILQEALKKEPDCDVKSNIQKVIKSQPLS